MADASLDFTNRAACLAYLENVLPEANAATLATLLDLSAATTCTDPPETAYRPFWVEANARLSTRTGEHESVRSAAGSQVVYRDTSASAANALLQRQAAIDTTLCNIPEGFIAKPAGGRVQRVATVF